MVAIQKSTSSVSVLRYLPDKNQHGSPNTPNRSAIEWATPTCGGTTNNPIHPTPNHTITMNERTTTSFEINGTEIEIKSRREAGSPSGWAVIAFCPSCSIRSTRIHLPQKLTSFATAIAASADGILLKENVSIVEEEIKSITINHDR